MSNKLQAEHYMGLALRLAERGYGATSPNPMVGALVVKGDKIIGRGWHRRAGGPHAEVEALRDAQTRGSRIAGATLYVTLEPCSTQGRTPPCTEAVIGSQIKRVVVGATDPNPAHCGKGLKLLRLAGVAVRHGILEKECEQLNEAFNHWIVHRTPFVTVKAAMTLDGKIATASGESKWITGEQSRAFGMKLRQGADAILVGINTILADDPSLTFREVQSPESKVQSHALRRIVLDSNARTPLSAKVVSDDQASITTIIVGALAPAHRVRGLAKRVNVLQAPELARSQSNRGHSRLDIGWLLRWLGSENVTSLLVEGGGEVNASFLLGGFGHRVAFFYAPTILGGRASRLAVAGDGVDRLRHALALTDVQWRSLGDDLFVTGLSSKNVHRHC